MYLNCAMTANTSTNLPPPPPPPQRKRGRQEIRDDEDVVVIALSTQEITAKKLFLCDSCDKHFIRKQNLLVHQRVHDLPYVRGNRRVKNKDEEKRKVYVCPDTTCANHYRRNALSDLTCLKKHYQRKHSEKTMSCSKCSKLYAVKGDLLAHERICGTKDYRCECGSRFSRVDNFTAHKTSCDAAMAQHLSSLQNEWQTSETTIGNNSISLFNNQPIFSSSSTTSMHSFPFSSNTMVAPSIPNMSSLDQFVHLNMTTTYPANNTGIQGNELSGNTFDGHVLHDILFDVSSVPSTILPHAGPQQGITWSDLEGTSASFLGNQDNSPTIYSDHDIFGAYPNSHFPALGTLSGTYGNPDLSINQGNNMVLNFQGNYQDITMNKNEATQNGGPSGFGIDQVNPNEQFSGNGSVGGDANFPVLQNDFNLWENWRY